MYLLFQTGGKLPDNKALSSEFAKIDELKKYMKRVMPFVQTTREKVDQIGIKALALTLEFDEAEVLKNNSAYLANTLNVSIVLWNFVMYAYVLFFSLPYYLYICNLEQILY